MKKSFHVAGAALVSLLLLCGSALADPTGPPNPDKASSTAFFAAPQVGTLGLGVHVGYQLNDIFKFRFNMNYMALNREQTVNDIKANAKFTGSTFGILADAHPFSGHFRFTGGLYYANLDVKLKGELESGKSYTIGNHTYTSADLGKGDGSVKWQRLAPYLGLGFGSGAGSDSGLSFSADLGVLVIGDPNVSMKFDRSAYDKYPGLGRDTSDYEDKAKKEIKSYLPVWPVLSLGVAYRF